MMSDVKAQCVGAMREQKKENPEYAKKMVKE